MLHHLVWKIRSWHRCTIKCLLCCTIYNLSKGTFAHSYIQTLCLNIPKNVTTDLWRSGIRYLLFNINRKTKSTYPGLRKKAKLSQRSLGRLPEANSCLWSLEKILALLVKPTEFSVPRLHSKETHRYLWLINWFTQINTKSVYLGNGRKPDESMFIVVIMISPMRCSPWINQGKADRVHHTPIAPISNRLGERESASDLNYS